MSTPHHARGSRSTRAVDPEVGVKYKINTIASDSLLERDYAVVFKAIHQYREHDYNRSDKCRLTAPAASKTIDHEGARRYKFAESCRQQLRFSRKPLSIRQRAVFESWYGPLPEPKATILPPETQVLPLRPPTRTGEEP